MRLVAKLLLQDHCCSFPGTNPAGNCLNSIAGQQAPKLCFLASIVVFQSSEPKKALTQQHLASPDLAALEPVRPNLPFGPV